jgi:hypothetical protein
LKTFRKLCSGSRPLSGNAEAFFWRRTGATVHGKAPPVLPAVVSKLAQMATVKRNSTHGITSEVLDFLVVELDGIEPTAS